MTLIAYHKNALWADRLQYENTFDSQKGEFLINRELPFFGDKINITPCKRIAYAHCDATIPPAIRPDIESSLIRIIAKLSPLKNLPAIEDSRDELSAIHENLKSTLQKYEGKRLLVLTHTSAFEINVVQEKRPMIIRIPDYDDTWVVSDKTSDTYFRFGLRIGMTPEEIFEYLGRATNWIGGGHTCVMNNDLIPFDDQSAVPPKPKRKKVIKK